MGNSNFYSVYNRAFLNDRDIEHTGDALVLAMYMHCKVKSGRTDKNEEEVARLLDDVNLKDN